MLASLPPSYKPNAEEEWRYLTLWTRFTVCCPLRWRLFWFWSESMDSCFIHCQISTQKFRFVTFELNTAQNSPHVLFVQPANAAPTLRIHYKANDIFTISDKSFNFTFLSFKTILWIFFWCHLIWTVFCIISVSTNMFEVSISTFYCRFWSNGLPITFSKSLLCLNGIFAFKKQCKIVFDPLF